MKKRVPCFFLCVLTVMGAHRADAGRVYQTHNTWHEKIPSDPKIMENSANYVNDILINSTRLSINLSEWSVPIWQASPSDPVVTVTITNSNESVRNAIINNGWNVLPMPPAARSAGMETTSYRDRHMSIIGYDGLYIWDFFGAKKDSSGNWFASSMRRWEKSGTGYVAPYDSQGTVRACPSSLLHGLITYDDIVNKGYIDHALIFSYWGEKKEAHWGLEPCQAYRTGVSDRQWAMLLGERIQLDPALDLDSLNLKPAAKIIARAMQEYGMIFAENCGVGCNAVYAEDLTGKPYSWSGILSAGDLANIPLNRLRVLEPLIPPPGSGTLAAPSNLQVD
jgi:hypothetical protein